jgi:hypothetical protein
MHSNPRIHNEKPMSPDCGCISAHIIPGIAILSSRVQTLFRLLWSLVDDDNVKPVIIEATEPISKSFRQYLSNTPGKHEIKELQKTAKLVTAHRLQEVLM